MNGGHDPDALDRIESALARIERASARLADRHNALRTRHAELREVVSASLVDLDALIANERGESQGEAPSTGAPQ